MRLTRLQLQNFKACRSVDLELAPLTVLIGANNAGKSSILHAIALPAQSALGALVSPVGRLVDLGHTLGALIHNQGRAAPTEPAVIRLSWTEDAADSPGFDVVTTIAIMTAPTIAVERGAEASAAQALSRFRYVGANRHVESSVFPLGERSVANPRTAQELVDTLAYNDELLERISERCQAIFGYGVDKDLIENRQITVVARGPSGTRNVVNLGTGFIQTVWLLTQLELAVGQASGSGSITPLIGIEEPELHIHPGRQPDIARLLGAFVRAGLNLICTTQSEHLLIALLSLVLEGELSADQIVVYYLRDGRAEKLAVDEQGRIEGGLRGFFEANEEQLRRQIELLKQRG